MNVSTNSNPRSMNLEDIAARAGVSRSTVSRVINNEPYVSEKTRERVLAIIEQEGFIPNPAARALVTQHTQVIGVVIPRTPTVVFEDAFYFPTLLQGVSAATHQRDYAMLLWLGQAGEDDERLYRQIERNRLMDGLIIASAPSNDPLISHFLNTSLPFVLVERPGHDYDRISYVSIDNLNASLELVTHLINLGRRRIATVTGDLTIPDGRDRLDGYKRALQIAGLPVDERLIVEGNFSQRSGYEGTQALLQQKIDAIVASSDITARGVLQALHEAEIRVPEDVAVVGFDDLPTAAQVIPPLTTVHQPIEERGRLAAGLLIDLVEGKLEGPQQILLPTELVIRQSCGAALS
ncbi:MAG: LacI family DNA-binding transcriptional regulator [Chloroflexi bacterium]|nr:LacI family DNA-binding transcriptional regulator [Chloroflexota bacterium]